MQCDDPDSLANNNKRPLNVNAPLFTPQTTMGNGGNILDQVRILSNLFNVCFKKIWTNYNTVSLQWFVQIFLKHTLFGILIKVRKFTVFFLGSNPKKTNEKIVIISFQTSKMGQIEKNAH